MAVKQELVREQLVAPLLARATELVEGPDPPALDAGWTQARQALAPEVGRNDDADRLARSLARAGYAAREAELEMFERAREGAGWLGEEISKREGDGEDADEARREICVGLAISEPSERPSPESGVASWRLPGPGGHVRHLVAVAAADQLLSGSGEPPVGLTRRRDVKRCWLYGLLMRAAEESSNG